MKTFFREILITAILALLIFFTVQATIQTFVVVGSSMQPSFQDGERLLVTKITYKLHQPERGDVVIFEPPDNQRTDYIKRIIAVPGDTIEVKTRTVYVNGSQLDEPYINSPPSYTLEEQKIPEESYFVLGDNRDNSNDSHRGWVVPRQNIVGKAWLSIWPPDKWGLVPDYPLQEQLTASMIK